MRLGDHDPSELFGVLRALGLEQTRGLTHIYPGRRLHQLRHLEAAKRSPF
jgi:hypothetical protein